MDKQQNINKLKVIFGLCVLLINSKIVKAQFYNLPNEFFFNTITQKNLSKIDSVQTHSSIEPYIPFFNKRYEFVADTYKIFKYITDDVAIDKVFFDHLIHIKSKDKKFEFKVDPLLNIELGRSFSDTTK